MSVSVKLFRYCINAPKEVAGAQWRFVTNAKQWKFQQHIVVVWLVFRYKSSWTGPESISVTLAI